MVLAGTGKEGKRKEVVKDREGKMVGMYVCMYLCIYVCMYACMHVYMYASDDDDIEERYLAAEVSNTNYGRHDTVTVTGKHHGYDPDICRFFQRCQTTTQFRNTQASRKFT